MNTTSFRRLIAGLSFTVAVATGQAQTSFIDYDYMGNPDQLDFDEAQNLEGKKILTDRMGGIYVAGTGQSDADGNDMILLKYTWNGSSFSLVWSYKYDGGVEGEDKLTGLVLDRYDVPYIAGSSEREGGGYDVVVIALNPVDGTKLWAGDGAARYNSSGTQDDFAYDFAIDKAESQNLIVAGKSSVSGSGDQGLSRYSSLRLAQ